MFSKSKSTGRNQIVLMNPAATTTTTTATTTAVAATAIELPILLQFLVPLLFFISITSASTFAMVLLFMLFFGILAINFVWLLFIFHIILVLFVYYQCMNSVCLVC